MDALNKLAEDPKLWDDPQAAQAKMQERTRLENAIKACRQLENQMNEHVELIELGEAEGDADVVAESEAALADLAAEAERMEVETLLSGEADGNDAYLEVHAGAGGTESQDWASMLQRMYMRWAEKKGYKVSLIEQTSGEEAGIKSATIEIKGFNAYGWAKTESGVHRLVRISPFDSNARRHTSFASVWCYPVVDDAIEIDVSEADVRIDTFVHPARADSTSTQPTARCALRICRPILWCNVKMSARSIRTVQPLGPCCGRGSTSLNCNAAKKKPMPMPTKKPRLAGGTKFVLMFCSLIKW